MKTKFQEFVVDAGRRRIFEQESLAFEATELISTLLKEQQLTKADLAKRIGKSKAYVTQLLSGSRNMTMHTFADLAFALGCKVELKSSPLAKYEDEVLVYRGEIQMHDALRRWSGRAAGVGASAPVPPPPDIFVEQCFGDLAPAA